MSLSDLQACRDYYEIVQAGDTPPPMCKRCEALLVYNLDSKDRVFFKCLGCNRMTFPGSGFFDAMREDYTEWKRQDG